MRHLGDFEVEVDAVNKPRLRPRGPVLQLKEVYKRAAEVNSEILDLPINNNATVDDWYHNHAATEPRCHNTELMEEALNDIGIPDELEQKKFLVYTRAGHLYNVIYPFFIRRPRGTGSTFKFNWKKGVLRIIESVQQFQNQGRNQDISRGHVAQQLLTNGPSENDHYTVGKNLTYTINSIEFGDVGVIISKEVDCMVNGEMAEIKKSEDMRGIRPLKILETAVKCVAFAGVSRLLCIHVADERVDTVKMAQLNGDQYVDRVVNICRTLLVPFILNNLQTVLIDRESANGQVTTYWPDDMPNRSFHLRISVDGMEEEIFRYTGESWENTRVRENLRHNLNWITPEIDANGNVDPAAPP